MLPQFYFIIGHSWCRIQKVVNLYSNPRTRDSILNCDDVGSRSQWRALQFRGSRRLEQFAHIAECGPQWIVEHLWIGRFVVGPRRDVKTSPAKTTHSDDTAVVVRCCHPLRNRCKEKLISNFPPKNTVIHNMQKRWKITNICCIASKNVREMDRCNEKV